TLHPENVTISAKKGDRIDVVADAWGMEEACHFEWRVSFQPRTVDMGSLRARI
ncbi:uncharacterized protein STEHIDRAFT_27281, partial [Stereum hirsutum FP-91666 SS1]|uniref:uncharacterized protein n=1 Tax=Stereum hirsutum (strain FP-91666) TaxID=721885 RepID=UPI000440FBC1